MKREADGGEMGSPNKRFRRGDEEVRLLIPSKVAGSIIGKGGQNITKLRSQYKASITVPDCPGPERMLTLSSDLDTICNIINDVVPNLEDNGARVNGNDLDLRMMIHQSQAGCVIGRGGQKIKEIRDKIGARIKIFSNCAPQSTDRIIQIIGQPQKCIQTIREVISLIKSSPIKGPVNPYDPHNYDDYYAEEYGGYGAGGAPDSRRGGPVGPPARGGPPAPPPPPQARNNQSSGGRFNNRGPPMSSAPRGNMSGFNDRGMGGPPPARGGSGGGGSGGYGGPPRSMNGGGSSFPRANPWAVNGEGGSLMNQQPAPPMLSPPGGPGVIGGPGGPGKGSTQVTIPKDLAGAIIGKGGGRIRKIRQDSGAGITIDEPLPGSNDRIITITGLPNQIQMAQYLLQQSVHNNTERQNNY